MERQWIVEGAVWFSCRNHRIIKKRPNKGSINYTTFRRIEECWRNFIVICVHVMFKLYWKLTVNFKITHCWTVEWTWVQVITCQLNNTIPVTYIQFYSFVLESDNIVWPSMHREKDMRNSVLAQVLDQSARARCKCAFRVFVCCHKNTYGYKLCCHRTKEFI